jgi:hypothetical protein
MPLQRTARIVALPGLYRYAEVWHLEEVSTTLLDVDEKMAVCM